MWESKEVLRERCVYLKGRAARFPRSLHMPLCGPTPVPGHLLPWRLLLVLFLCVGRYLLEQVPCSQALKSICTCLHHAYITIYPREQNSCPSRSYLYPQHLAQHLALCLINNIGERKTDEVIGVNLEIVPRANRAKWGKQEIWMLLGLGLNYSCVTLDKT